MSDRRKAQHRQQIESIRAYAYHHYGAPPHPTDIEAADAQLKAGIDEDWRNSVQRYPEVLEYFFSLVEVSLPTENDPSVKGLPLSTLPLPRHVNRRSQSRPPPGNVISGSAHNGGTPTEAVPPRISRGRTPPAIEPARGRTPGPLSESRYHRLMPAPARSSYNGEGFPYQR